MRATTCTGVRECAPVRGASERRTAARARARRRARRRRRRLMKKRVPGDRGDPRVVAAATARRTDPTALTAPIAQNVTISEITMLQSLEVPVMRERRHRRSHAPRRAHPDSQPVHDPAHRAARLDPARLRHARVGVLDALDHRARPHRDDVADGNAWRRCSRRPATITTPSQQFDLTSTINIPDPGCRARARVEHDRGAQRQDRRPGGHAVEQRALAARRLARRSRRERRRRQLARDDRARAVQRRRLAPLAGHERRADRVVPAALLSGVSGRAGRDHGARSVAVEQPDRRRAERHGALLQAVGQLRGRTQPIPMFTTTRVRRDERTSGATAAVVASRA